jgi:DMSO/TMAO reductase YedYZ heme-binding membrane subunit
LGTNHYSYQRQNTQPIAYMSVEYVQQYEEYMKIGYSKTMEETRSEKHLWLDSISVGFLVFALSLLYVYIEYDVLNIRMVNKALAWSGLIMIGLSFALTGLNYFWNGFSDKIIYRKHLGLVGFWLAVSHTVLTIFRSGVHINLPFILGVSALVIFAMMAVISNQYAVHEVGGVMWKKLLRVGYAGLVLAALHAIFLGRGVFVLLLFVSAVLALRIVMEIDLRRNRKTSAP